MEENHLGVPHAFRALAVDSRFLVRRMKEPGDARVSRRHSREPGGGIPPGHPTSVLCQRPSVNDEFESIDAEYAGLPGIGRAARAVDRENVHLDGGIAVRFLRMAECAGIGDGEK